MPSTPRIRRRDLKTSTRSLPTMVALAVAGLVLALAAKAPQLLTHGLPDGAGTSKPIPIPSVSDNEGYVIFHLKWLPTGHSQDVTFMSLTVNGQPYLVEPHPALRTQPRWPGVTEGTWDSPRIPIPPKQTAEQVKAQLVTRLFRPSGYKGRLWAGCKIEINGRPAPGYGQQLGRGVDHREKFLVYTCATPPATK
jgi:hypothetical protein